MVSDIHFFLIQEKYVDAYGGKMNKIGQVMIIW